MNISEVSTKAAVSVSEMAEMCLISRSTWYELVEAKVFPKPVLHPSSKRPIYDRNLQEKCLEIRASGIGLNGNPVLFNRKTKKSGAKQKPLRPEKDKRPHPVIEPVLEALQSLGLATTAQAVDEAVAALYPAGIAGQDRGDVIRKTFLYLQGKRP